MTANGRKIFCFTGYTHPKRGKIYITPGLSGLWIAATINQYGSAKKMAGTEAYIIAQECYNAFLEKASKSKVWRKYE